ncbi:hypothetical protein Pcinc_010501 [Petrolisthes cinctipes]|uniref:Uncharacterized protein n=1 Tax=Petrolisthes cinctipes TaxID=88211 RepID=A0AAE1G594_PETCI|nr:hypothetical protein Pcinc_010501 [Petrolisthes cinctipes]
MEGEERTDGRGEEDGRKGRRGRKEGEKRTEGRGEEDGRKGRRGRKEGEKRTEGRGEEDGRKGRRGRKEGEKRTEGRGEEDGRGERKGGVEKGEIKLIPIPARSLSHCSLSVCTIIVSFRRFSLPFLSGWRRERGI